MCTNRALVDSLECYMEDLVDNFEDFVKKSIIVIAIAVGFLVAMIGYVLKTVTDRSQTALTNDTTASNTPSRFGTNQNPCSSDISLKCRKGKVRKRSIAKDYLMLGYQSDKDSMTNADNDTISCNEKILKDIGFSGCQRPGCGSSLSKTRSSIPSLPTECETCTSKDESTTKGVEKEESCCSMCCDNKCEN